MTFWLFIEQKIAQHPQKAAETHYNSERICSKNRLQSYSGASNSIDVSVAAAAAAQCNCTN